MLIPIVQPPPKKGDLYFQRKQIQQFPEMSSEHFFLYNDGPGRPYICLPGNFMAKMNGG